MIKLKTLLTEITLSGVAPYATQFVWKETGSDRNDIEFVEARVTCDGVLMAFNFDKHWSNSDEFNWGFSIIATSTDTASDRFRWTISHEQSDATGKISYFRLMRTALEAVLDFIRVYDVTSIDVTGSDNLPHKDEQKTRIYRALLAANTGEIVAAGFTVLDRAGKLWLVRRSRADSTGIRNTP